MQSSTKLRAGIIGLALTFFLLLQFLAQFPAFVEKYYSNTLYPVITVLVSNFAGQFNFSITEFMLWFLILISIPFTINRFRKKRTSVRRVLLNLATFIAVVYVWFYMFWGLNYLRQPLKTKLQLDTVQLPMDAFDSTFVQIIRRCNELNFAYSISELAQINATIDSSYDFVFEDLKLKKIAGYKGFKAFALNWLLNKTTTSGWFSPFFHEVHYNSDLLIFELPFIIAHEKAHQKGYSSESEANFLAFLVCTSSGDPLCEYSGYFQVLAHFLNALQDHPERKEFYLNALNRGVRFNLEEVRERWRSHMGFVASLARKGYDLYLKSNNVKEGIDSYALVVDYIVRYEQQRKSKLAAESGTPYQ